jgi:hypothetical protein
VRLRWLYRNCSDQCCLDTTQPGAPGTYQHAYAVNVARCVHHSSLRGRLSHYLSAASAEAPGTQVVCMKCSPNTYM